MLLTVITTARYMSVILCKGSAVILIYSTDVKRTVSLLQYVLVWLLYVAIYYCSSVGMWSYRGAERTYAYEVRERLAPPEIQ